MLDQFNRDINYLRISVTDRCNLRCKYCMPEEGVILKDRDHILSFELIFDIVKEAVLCGIRKIRITGGEPLIRKDISQLIYNLKKNKGLEEITLTTNGILLASMALELKKAGLDRINISLDTLNPDKYSDITRGGELKKVLDGIDAVLKIGFSEIKINMVLIPGFNENEVDSMKYFCHRKGLKLQRINQYLLHNQLCTQNNENTERPLPCECCNRIRLTADGKFKPCLFSDIEMDIDLSDIKKSLKKTINLKPQKGILCKTRGIWEIGG